LASYLETVSFNRVLAIFVCFFGDSDIVVLVFGLERYVFDFMITDI